MSGWGKPRQVGKYAGVCERTVRSWLRIGLKHSRLPSGTILIRYDDVDEFLLQYSTDNNKDVEGIVEDVLNTVRGD